MTDMAYLTLTIKKKQNNAFCCNIQFINVAMMHMNKGMSVSGTGDLIL